MGKRLYYGIFLAPQMLHIYKKNKEKNVILCNFTFLLLFTFF